MAPALGLTPTDDAYVRALTTITQRKLNRRSLMKERRDAAQGLRLALRAYRKDPDAEMEDLILFALRQRIQAVLRQILAHPLGNDVPLVQFLLSNSSRLRTHLTARGWI